MEKILILSRDSVAAWQQALGLKYDWQTRIPPTIGAALALAVLAEEVPDGFYLAKQECLFTGCLEQNKNYALAGKITKMIESDALDCLTCEVTISHAGETLLALTSTLVRPKRENEKNDTKADGGQTCPAEQPIQRRSFSPGEIRRYTQLSGDRNDIHQGDHPVVPGMLCLLAIEDALALQGIFCRRFSVQYKRPLYASEDLALYLQNDFLSGKVQNQLHLKLKWEA